MNYKIERVESKEVWDSFLKGAKHLNILSSWEWIEFEKSLGFDTQAYSIENAGVFAFRSVNSKKGKYLILRQNVFLDWYNEGITSSLLDFLKIKCKEKGCSFFRIAPPLLYSFENEKKLESLGFKKSVIHETDGQLTTILDLTQNSDDILKNMRKNTRYLVKKAQKIGVEVLDVDALEYFEDFEKIYKETVSRHKWNASDLEYIKKQYTLFSSKGLSKMFVAKFKGEVLGCAIFTKFQNQVIYHHSGSISTDIPVMYALIWKAIEHYKNLGLKEFNFFGVCEKDQVNHSWYGLSLFKRGFGGSERRLMHSYDYPLSLRYHFIRGVEKFTRD